MRDPALRARVLSAETGAAFPWKPAPSLSGPLRGLAFGMTPDEARAAAPAVVPAFKDFTSKSSTAAQWAPLGAGKAAVRIYERGVDMIEVVYPSEAVARRELEAAWGSPRVGESSFRWVVWTNAAHGIRATLMQGDGGQHTRLELLPYRPLAELLADGAELAWKGKHLLDCTAADLEPITRGNTSGDDVQLLPTELSSGHIPLRVVVKDGAVTRYTLGVDTTYDLPTGDVIREAIRRHFGAARAEPREPLSVKECFRFAPTAAGVEARACVLYHQWQITVARAGEELGL